jgi:hypothetical protein
VTASGYLPDTGDLIWTALTGQRSRAGGPVSGLARTSAPQIVWIRTSRSTQLHDQLL